MKLLVSGGSGFIGSNVIRRLIDKPEIERLVNLDCLTYAGCLENLSGVDQHPKYVFEKVDLRDKSATFEVLKKHRITHVMHLAAESHVDRSITGPGDFIHTNIIGTFHLLEACRELWTEGKAETLKTENLKSETSPVDSVSAFQLFSVSAFRFVHVSTDEVYGNASLRSPSPARVILPKLKRLSKPSFLKSSRSNPADLRPPPSPAPAPGFLL